MLAEFVAHGIFPLPVTAFQSFPAFAISRLSGLCADRFAGSLSEIVINFFDGDGIGREDKVGRCRLGGFPATAHANACDSRSNRQHDDNRNPNSLFTANVHILSD